MRYKKGKLLQIWGCMSSPLSAVCLFSTLLLVFLGTLTTDVHISLFNFNSKLKSVIFSLPPNCFPFFSFCNIDKFMHLFLKLPYSSGLFSYYYKIMYKWVISSVRVSIVSFHSAPRKQSSRRSQEESNNFPLVIISNQYTHTEWLTAP